MVIFARGRSYKLNQRPNKNIDTCTYWISLITDIKIRNRANNLQLNFLFTFWCLLGKGTVLAEVPLEGKTLAAVWPSGRRRLAGNPLDGKVVGSNTSSCAQIYGVWLRRGDLPWGITKQFRKAEIDFWSLPPMGRFVFNLRYLGCLSTYGYGWGFVGKGILFCVYW